MAGLLPEETRPELATAQSGCCHPLKAPVNNHPGNSWDSLEEEVTGIALKGQAPVGVAGESWAGMRAADAAQGPGHRALPPQLQCPPNCLCCLCQKSWGAGAIGQSAQRRGRRGMVCGSNLALTVSPPSLASFHKVERWIWDGLTGVCALCWGNWLGPRPQRIFQGWVGNVLASGEPGLSPV